MPALPAGSIAPEFTLQGLDGSPYTLSAALTKGPALLVFFKISCPTCQYGMRYFSRIGEHLAGTSATVWAVSQTDLDSTRAFNQQFESNLTSLADREDDDFAVSNAYGITNVPTAFVINQDGLVTHFSVGWVKTDVVEMAAAMSSAVDRPPYVPFRPGEDIIAYKGG